MAPLQISCVLQSPLFSLKKSSAERRFGALNSAGFRTAPPQAAALSQQHNRVLKSSFYQFLNENLFLPALPEALLSARLQRQNLFPFAEEQSIK